MEIFIDFEILLRDSGYFPRVYICHGYVPQSFKSLQVVGVFLCRVNLIQDVN